MDVRDPTNHRDPQNVHEGERKIGCSVNPNVDRRHITHEKKHQCLALRCPLDVANEYNLANVSIAVPMSAALTDFATSFNR